MRFIKFTVFFLFFIIAYLAHVLSKLNTDHVHEIALTFVAIGSILAGGVNLLGALNNSEIDVVESDDDAST